MAYAFVGSGTFSNNIGAAGSVNYTPITGNTLIVYAFANGATSGLTLSDGTNTYNYLGGTASGFLGMWWAHVTSSGPVTISLSNSGTFGIFVKEFSGLASVAYVTSSFQQQVQGGATVGANTVSTGTSPNVTSVPALLDGITVVSNALFGTDPTATVGTTLAYIGRTVGWLGNSSQQAATNEDVRITSAGSQPVNFGAVSGNQFDTFYTCGAAFAESSGAVFDGTASAASSVSTGTGGTALPAFNVGDCIHVLCMAQTTNPLTETFSGDGSNTYTHLQIADNHSTEGFIFSRYMTIVTTPLTTPTITDTWSGSATKLAIAVAKVPNINVFTPNVTGGNQQHLQTTPTGTDSQTSTLTPSANTLVPVTLGAWGFCVNETSVPAAGTGFTSIGTAWAALGSACLRYETQVSNAAVQQVATFTPPGGTDTYTFLDVFNMPTAPVPFFYNRKNVLYFV
jgi:hypothetical protein